MLRYEFKFFLEGIEIPFVGLDLNFGIDSSFGVEVAPVNEVNDLVPNSHGLIIFRRKGTDSKWYLLAEGWYSGPSYQKQATSRALRLKFNGVTWFIQNTPFYNLVTPSAGMDAVFALKYSAFVGDIKRTDGSMVDTGEKVANITSQAKFDFLSTLLADRGDSDPITTTFKQFMDYLKGANPYMDKAVDHYKITSDRMMAIENPKMKDLLIADNLLNHQTALWAESTVLTTIFDVLWNIANIGHYEIMAIPCMAKDGGSSINSLVVKPNLPLAIPPACNVIFPDETVSLGFDINYSIRPTRLWYQGQLVSENGQDIMHYYFAPEDINKVFQEPDPKPYLTQEEKLRGIVPRIESFPFVSTLVIPEGSDEKTVDEYQSQFANFQFYKYRYESVPLNVTASFKPDLLPGFPVLVLDRIIPLIGYVVNITHNIDVQSAVGFTGITLSHVRPARETVPALPGWYDSQTFAPKNIGANVYSKLGTKIFCTENVPEIDGNGNVSFKSAVDTLLEQYIERGPGFQEWFYRDMPVFYDEGSFNEPPKDGEILQALNLTWARDKQRLEPNGKGPCPLNMEFQDESGTFRPTEIRQEAVLKMRTALSKQKGVWSRLVLKD